MAYGLWLMVYAFSIILSYGFWLVANGSWLLAYAIYLIPYALYLTPYALYVSIVHKIGHAIIEIVILMAYGLWFMAYCLGFMGYAFIGAFFSFLLLVSCGHFTLGKISILTQDNICPCT